MRDVDQLTACLADLDRDGWKKGDFVADRPEVSASLRASLRAAERVKALTRPIPSDAFRARSRSHLITFIQNSAVSSPGPSRTEQIHHGLLSIFRPMVAPLLAAALMVIGLAGVWSASASALPGTPLYPAKIAIEWVQLATALTPDQRVWVHLNAASMRLQEANAMIGAGQVSEGQELLNAYDNEIAQAQSILLNAATLAGSDNLLAQSHLQIVRLQAERQRVASSLVSTPSTGQTRSTPAGVVQSIGTPGAVAGASVSVTTTVSPADSSRTTQPGASPESSANSAGSSLGGTPLSPSPATIDADRIHRLILVLVAQAAAGDSDAANLTARQLELELTTGNAAGTLSVERLALDRSLLEEALRVAPASSQISLRLALASIDAVAPSSRSASSPTSVAPASSPPASAVSITPAVPTIVAQKVTVAPILTPSPVVATQGPQPVVPTQGPQPVVPTQIPQPVLPTPIPQPVPPTPIPRPVLPAPVSEPPSPPLGGKHQTGDERKPRLSVLVLSTLTGPSIARPVIVPEPVHLPSPTLTELKPSVPEPR